MNCPQCSGEIVETYWVCPHCKADLKKPEISKVIETMAAKSSSRTKQIGQLAKTLIVGSLLSGFAIGITAYSTSKMPEELVSRHAGFRQLVGYSLAAMAAAHMVCAILLLTTKRSLFAWAPIVITAGLAIAWLIATVNLDSEEQARRGAKVLVIPIVYGGLLFYMAKRLQRAKD